MSNTLCVSNTHVLKTITGIKNVIRLSTGSWHEKGYGVSIAFAHNMCKPSAFLTLLTVLKPLLI